MPSVPATALNGVERNPLRVLLTGFGVSVTYFLLHAMLNSDSPLTIIFTIAFRSLQGEPIMACSQASPQ